MSNQIGTVNDMATFDDGQGPELYIGGDLSLPGAPGPTGVLRWTGEGFAPLSNPIDTRVFVLRAFSFGGPALFAGGSFTSAGGVPAARIARFNGSVWSSLGNGTDGTVKAIAIFDDGSGAAVYAGGAFAMAGGVPASRIAKWDGAAWLPLGVGVNGEVTALAAFDDGSGPALYVGGAFTSAGGISVDHVARWSNGDWNPIGIGLAGNVNALAVYDGALYAGGNFFGTVVRWDGSTWSTIGSLRPSGVVNELTVGKDSDGPGLFAGGSFSILNGGSQTYRVAKLVNSTWSYPLHGPNSTVVALESLDDGSGPRVFAGGSFTTVGPRPDSAPGFAIWDGANWSHAPSSSVSGSLQAMCTADDGHGRALFVGGSFTYAGAANALNVARWDGSTWSALGGGIEGGQVYSLAAFAGGPMQGVYAGGNFGRAGGASANCIARWDGSSWSSLTSGLTGLSPNYAYAMLAYDDGSGPALYIGGYFAFAGGVSAPNVARWDGASWSGLGSGMNDAVLSLAVYNDGGGPKLYAGGNFTMAGGVPARSIARWNGSSWSALEPLGSSGTVLCLAVFDDGSGPGLYAGGTFDNLGGVANTRHIARWSGGSWSPLGLGMANNGTVRAMTVYDDGSGPALYALGEFSQASATPTLHIARWKDFVWTAVEGGLLPNNCVANTAAAFDDGIGADRLYVGGTFDSAGPIPSYRIAEWVGCPVCYANCDHSTPAPRLNILDFACFVNRFASGDPYANCDGSTVPPVINVIDFACFLNRFAVGCP